MWKEGCELLEHRSSLYYAINHGCTYAGKGRCHPEGVGLPLLRNNVVHPYPGVAVTMVITSSGGTDGEESITGGTGTGDECGV